MIDTKEDLFGENDPGEGTDFAKAILIMSGIVASGCLGVLVFSVGLYKLIF